MIKGVKVRLSIHNILFNIFKYNKTINNHSIQKLINNNKLEDIAFINKVTLSSMRYYFHAKKIINKYVKKRIKDHEKILLLSAITQLVFLNFKEYAVINCSVEIAKKLNIYHGFINAVLKKILLEKKELSNIKITFNDLPLWVRKTTKNLTYLQKENFISNFYKEPDIHIVFKNKFELKKFEEKILKSSENSGFLIENKRVDKIKSFKDGSWWVQDFSSSFPINNLKRFDNKKSYLDMCSAPGGKAFQILSRGVEVSLYDKSKSRIKILKENLKRLNFNAEVINNDALNISKKYDFIIVDAPCTAIGTIRRNPEIFFKSNKPDLKKLLVIQEKLLIKAADLLNMGGIILYMVCSFLKIETNDQINNFLEKRKDFKISTFPLLNNQFANPKLIYNNCMLTMPGTMLGKNIDGYFAVYLKKV